MPSRLNKVCHCLTWFLRGDFDLSQIRDMARTALRPAPKNFRKFLTIFFEENEPRNDGPWCGDSPPAIWHFIPAKPAKPQNETPSPTKSPCQGTAPSHCKICNVTRCAAAYGLDSAPWRFPAPEPRGRKQSARPVGAVRALPNQSSGICSFYLEITIRTSYDIQN